MYICLSACWMDVTKIYTVGNGPHCLVVLSFHMRRIVLVSFNCIHRYECLLCKILSKMPHRHFMLCLCHFVSRVMEF